MNIKRCGGINVGIFKGHMIDFETRTDLAATKDLLAEEKNFPDRRKNYNNALWKQEVLFCQ